MSTKSNQQAMGLQVFYNEEANVNIRTEVVNNEPWFVAKDVCDALGINKYRDALGRLDEDEKGCPVAVDTLGGKQEMAGINESGLYNLIFQSRKPEARTFRRWVTNVVLPSIRRTGSYSSIAVQPAIEQRTKLPLPKFRPFYAEWKKAVTPYISNKEAEQVAKDIGVTIAHVRKVYLGTSVSAEVVLGLTAYASVNRANEIIYPPKQAVYEQMMIMWEENDNQ